ncbi:serine/threonine protein phosphatase 6 regulatory ankyrin repeat subunit A [Trifolium medium]|uniref:Serine/threonine protein phosphatase 6 regulatory ankyrin repeat subunit A n=1 Tax=Trifolium medium TaxID=97028 RepID=A0A392MH68_9FABA|nr:serine/threonine protein phosphatase 6 regulatory ankyrin repeat subunit A [Trifolium medium]
MRGQWREVLEANEKNLEVLEAKITKAEDTVLHMAVYVNQIFFVTTLLDNISQNMCRDILRMQNSKRNTPLHVAAEFGNVDICNNIAKRDHTIVSFRNFEGETPLFVAAVHGKRDAFFCPTVKVWLKLTFACSVQVQFSSPNYERPSLSLLRTSYHLISMNVIIMMGKQQSKSSLTHMDY